MGIKQSLLHGAAKITLEMPGSRKSVAEWADALEDHGAAIDARAAKTTDADKAQRMLRHISGIERWGQRRLRVFLGAAEAVDEHDGYCPATDLTTDEQRAEFQATRQETVTLARQLAATSLDPEMKVTHNDFGPLTPRGWLRYLDMHANLEMKKVRSA